MELSLYFAKFQALLKSLKADVLTIGVANRIIGIQLPNDQSAYE